MRTTRPPLDWWVQKIFLAVIIPALFLSCLAKDPRDRFASAAAMQAELVPAIREYSGPLPHEPACAEADTLVRE